MGAPFPVFYFAESCTEAKKMHGCQRATLLARVPRKRTGCHFQCSTQVSGIKSKTPKSQLQQNTITWLTAAVIHILSLLQLALLQRPRCCWSSPTLRWRRTWLWREISGRADLGCAVSAALPRALRVTHGTGAWGSTVGGRCTQRSGAAAPSPQPAPHSVSKHFHTHRGVKEGQWQARNTKTLHETLQRNS